MLNSLCICNRGRLNFVLFFVFSARTRLKKIFGLLFFGRKDAHIFGLFYLSVQIWP